MTRAFTEIAFTASVKAMQTKQGSRGSYARVEQSADRADTLDDFAADFIGQRDSFYISSVAENGWPYVQHRGGPEGFLRVLGPQTIAYAELSGNRQYLSVGNLMADDRAAMILMDYANRRRLKIWGRVRIVEPQDDPALIASLNTPAYRAKVERAVVITVQALDWNCPQHITPRFSETEIAFMLKDLQDENRRLKEQIAQADKL
jgi:hypothetical protein